MLFADWGFLDFLKKSAFDGDIVFKIYPVSFRTGKRLSEGASAVALSYAAVRIPVPEKPKR